MEQKKKGLLRKGRPSSCYLLPLFTLVPFDLPVLLPFVSDGAQWHYRSRNDRNFKGFYHWHQICEILIVHEGRGRVIVDPMTLDIRRGMLFFFQPFQLHKVYPDVSPETPYPT